MTAATRSFDTSGVLRALRESPSHRAPASLLPAVLARVGLADRYWRLDSPVGAVYIAASRAGSPGSRCRNMNTSPATMRSAIESVTSSGWGGTLHWMRVS